jgi:hypothetical protein
MGPRLKRPICLSMPRFPIFPELLRCAWSPTTPSQGHFLRHQEDEFSVGIPGFAEALFELMKINRLLDRTSPSDIVRRFPFQKLWQLGRLVAFVEELVQRDL